VNIIKIPEIPKFIDIINSKDNRIFGGKLLWFDILYRVCFWPSALDHVTMVGNMKTNSVCMIATVGYLVNV